MRALIRLAPVLLVALAACRSGESDRTRPLTEPSTAFTRVDERLKLQYDRATPPPEVPKAPWTSPPAIVDRVETTGGVLRPILRADAPRTMHPAEVTLPASADGAFTLHDRDTGAEMRARLLGAEAIPAKIEGDRVAYPGAFAGGDVVHRVRGDGTEDFLWVPSSETRVAYEVEPGRGIAGLRLVEDTLELVDAKGAPRLRISPPYLVGADGRTHPAHLAVEGCRFDTNPVAPWDRPVVAAGAKKCLVKVTWATDGIAYPALVDPGWRTTGNMATSRSFFAMHKLASGRVFAYGGENSSGTVSTAELYDAGTGTWGATGGWFPGRSQTGSVVLGNGSVFVSGGYNTSVSGQALQSTGIYSPSTGSFTTFANMSVARRGHTATLLSDGRVLLAGGHNGSYLTKAEIFDPPTSSSVPVGDLAFARLFHTATLLADGRVAVLGGLGPAASPSAVEIFDRVALTWSQKGSIAPRTSPAAVTLPDGSVLVAGGAGASAPGAELYNPSTGATANAYASTIPQSIAMLDFGAGSVLITGGSGSSTVLRYDQSLSQMVALNSMLYARAGHGIALLDNASVLAAGGYAGSLYLAQAELLSTLSCSSSAQCPNGRTCADGYCCDTACAGACDRCDVAGKEGTCSTAGAGSAGVPTCAPYACDGTNATCPATCSTDSTCATGYYCSGGGCVAKKTSGQTCSRVGECATGNCVDGFCCNSSCSGGCDRCDVTGSEGTCTLVAGGGTNPSCSPYLCSGTSGACPTSCASDAACASGYVCYNSTCIPPRSLGSSCNRNVECTSGFCADGVCCNNACSGSCDSCGQSGSVGTCRVAGRGTTPSPGCGPYACDGTNVTCPTTCSIDADCVGGNYCSNGSCVPKQSLGAGCTASNQCSSGYCADGFCCSSSCSGNCDRCDVAGFQGSCRLISGDGNCSPNRCSGGSSSCTSGCTYDTDCASTGYCSASTCWSKRAVGSSCNATNQCLSGNCVDGVCCDTPCSGACDQCALPGRQGTCTPLAAGTAGSCGGYVCDGVGGACPSGCTNDANCATGYACRNNSCVPNLANGASCSASGPCVSGYCVDGVCCSAACSGPCDACNIGGSVGTCTPYAANTAVGSCSPYTCPGTGGACRANCTADANCASAYYCNNGQCVPKLGNAQFCTRDTQCASGACADGVCCNSACGGACDRCDSVGNAGTCIAVAAGSLVCNGYYCDGGGDCPTSCASDAACAPAYFCSSANTCLPKKNVGASCGRAGECANGVCVDGYCCNSACTGGCDRCDLSGNLGNCTPLGAGATGSCGNFLCGAGAACPTSCTSDNQCVSTAFCLNGTCTPKRANGATCPAGNACVSGNCVDGYCCNTACAGACDRCDAIAGTCTLSATSVSCGAYLCSGTSADCPTACTQDGQCSAGNYCNGAVCVPKLTAGKSCSRSAMCGSGNCVDGFCCNTACSAACDRCDLTPGTCLPSEAGHAGTCGLYTCNGSIENCPISCSEDTDCTQNAWCSGGRCVAKSANGNTCTQARSCSSGFCVDGVCCNTGCNGSCDRCDLQGSSGTCAPVAAGTDGSCAPYTCNGTSGACPASCTSDATCLPGYACRGSRCVANTPDGNACTAAAQCTSGTCWNGTCCESACSGACESCQLAGNAGRCLPVPDDTASRQGACAPYLCGGTSGSCPTTCASSTDCTNGAFCDANHHCVGTYAIGHACAGDGECAAGRCVDGFCCDSACGGDCDQCNVAGSEGRCVPKPAQTVSTDPACAYLCDGANATCPTSCRTGADCLSGNWCRSGQCVAIGGSGASCTADAGCSTGHCADGVCCDSACTGGCDRCDVPGTVGLCRPLPAGATGSSPSCGNYVCDGTRSSCPIACASDDDCASGTYCSGTRCVPKLAAGATCSASRQCQGGVCADGVCCDRACDGQCEACNLSGRLGRCSPVVGTPVGGRAACAGASSDPCRGACDGRTGASCTYPAQGFTCREASCEAGAASARSTCDGAGTCVAGEVVDCGAYACEAGGATCRTSCSADADCAGGFHCAGGRCVNDLPGGSACRLGAECASGFCTDGVCCDGACGGGCDRCDLPGNKGTCTAVSGAVPACAPYLCDGTRNACPDACADDSGCAEGFRCLAGACLPVARVGEACSDARACATGFCVDGLCCESACEGSCASCALPGHEGSCTLVTGAAAPGRTACGGEGGCGGTCDGSKADCTFPGAELACAPGFCSEGAAVSPGRCDGKGLCGGVATTRCPGGCEAGRCLDTVPAGGCASVGFPAGALLGLGVLLGRRRRRS